MKQLITKLQNLYLIGASVLLVLLLQGSSSLAQESIWTKKANIPTARIHAASCSFDGKIYVIGGNPGPSSSGVGIDNMEVYDLESDSWDTTKASMPTARLELGVCSVNGKIYAIGGAQTHSGTAFGMVEEYDPSSDSWTAKTPKPSPRKGAAYGVIDNKIYVAGGTAASYNVASNKLEIYDPSTDTWDISKSPMPRAVYVPGGAVLDGKFYVIGGLVGSPWVGQRTVQIYDPATDTWSYGPALLEGRAVPATAVVNDQLYVIGGDSELALVTTVEKFDLDSNSWTSYDHIPVGMTMNTATAIGSEIYLISGSTTPYMDITWSSAVHCYIPDLVSPTDVDLANIKLPKLFVLHQNYPNPFNPSTTIIYSIQSNEKRETSNGFIPSGVEGDIVQLKIYDILGREVATLVNKKQKPGNYEVEWNAKNQPSGIYFYQLKASTYTETKKMLMIK